MRIEGAAQARSGEHDWTHGLQEEQKENKRAELQAQIDALATELQTKQVSIKEKTALIAAGSQNKTFLGWSDEKRARFEAPILAERDTLVKESVALEIRKATLEAKVEELEGRLKS